MKEGMRWAENHDDWGLSRINGQKKLIYGDQELLVRSIDAAYGESCGLVLLDEAWDIQSSQVAEGIEPTVLGAEGSIGYTTTAHRKATSLVLNLRQRAFTTLDNQSDEEALLIIEWSAERGLSIDDEEAWRQASPEWTSYRRRLIAKRLKAARSGEILDPTEPDPIKAFEAQYLNRFPIKQTRRGPGETLFESGAWASALTTSLVPLYNRVVAIEDNYGKGLAVVEAGISASEQIAVRGEQFEDRAAAWEFAKSREADMYLLGASLGADPAARDLSSRYLRGSRETRDGLSQLRALVNGGAITHDGGPNLADQMLGCRVRNGATGMVIASKTRHDLVRAVCWAVTEVHTQRGAVAGVH